MTVNTCPSGHISTICDANHRMKNIVERVIKEHLERVILHDMSFERASTTLQISLEGILIEFDDL